MFALDNAAQINRIIYYPVILNGVIVGGYQICEQLENQEISVQASPLLANELNLMMDLTSEETPLILGYNNDNTIGIKLAASCSVQPFCRERAFEGSEFHPCKSDRRFCLKFTNTLDNTSLKKRWERLHQRDALG